MKEIIQKYWFLIALVGLLLAGYVFSSPLQPLAEWEWAKWAIIFVTMFLMAWPLSFSHLKSTMAQPRPVVLATIMNIVVIPLLAWPLAGFAGPELGPGILIAAATPSTLASAAVWTRRALGNDSVAVMVTLATNASCFFVLPLWIYIQTGDQIDPRLLFSTIGKLLFFVVLPMGLAQLMRLHQRSAHWATKIKPQLSVVALVGVLAIVFLGAIKMGARFESNNSAGEGLSIFRLAIALLIVSFLHSFTFWSGIWLAGWLGFSRADQIAVGFSGSQKTLMIGLSTAITLGFSMIPIVMFHTSQLLVDAVFAERIRAAEATGEKMG